jgi:hypothetical protein
MSISKNETLVPVADADAVGLGVGRRSLARRIANPPPGFPVVIRGHNGRLYMRRSDIEAYKQRLVVDAMKGPFPAHPSSARAAAMRTAKQAKEAALTE